MVAIARARKSARIDETVQKMMARQLPCKWFPSERTMRISAQLTNWMRIKGSQASTGLWGLPLRRAAQTVARQGRAPHGTSPLRCGGGESIRVTTAATAEMPRADWALGGSSGCRCLPVINFKAQTDTPEWNQTSQQRLKRSVPLHEQGLNPRGLLNLVVAC